MKRNHFIQTVKNTTKKWWQDDTFHQSAVIAYYAIFSIPVLLVIIIHMAGIAFGDAAVSGKVVTSVSDMLGQNTALQIQNILLKAIQIKNSVLATVIGIVTLVFGATGVFVELQKSFNNIWQVDPNTQQGFLKLLKDRLLSFGLIVSIGFLLAVSLVITSILTAISGWIGREFSVLAVYAVHSINILFSITLISTLFAIMFKVLPDVTIKWKHIWPGAVLTAILFIGGKYALEYYFVQFQPTSIYGAAGTIVLLLLWVSYSCIIVLYGAEFTKQYTITASK